ncbi:PPOX class F420-dependent oxidoreductase [Microbacterium hydrothermale]|uniref:PPOX class F420-dependent oxidoreductase n=1 Tax=Microbacterium hydrothermale TaxID=857427 RepID=UPI0010A8F3E5|nr:PPOX class F420-dependent oxidoreductase [Microbacterium hydrothermale]
MIPDAQRDLLENPNYGSLGTVRPDGTVQVNPMWFSFDGEHLLFTHTVTRQKYRNLQRNPSMSLMVFDPERPYRYIEVRGRLLEAEPDPEGAFYVFLGKRYGNAQQDAPADRADRVILKMSIDKVGGQ